VVTTLRYAGKAVAVIVPVSQLARLGLPALIVLGFLAILILAISCWIIASDDRSSRMARLMLAARGRPAVPARRPPRRLELAPSHAAGPDEASAEPDELA
jgi:hypothetical protein